MTVFRSFGSAAVGGLFAAANGINSALDGLTGVVGRLNDRFEAHWNERTKLLRTHYADAAARRAKPLPVVEAPIDLSMRGGVKEAA